MTRKGRLILGSLILILLLWNFGGEKAKYTLQKVEVSTHKHLKQLVTVENIRKPGTTKVKTKPYPLPTWPKIQHIQNLKLNRNSIKFDPNDISYDQNLLEKLQTDLQVIILSKRENYYQRETIRKTWAKNYKNIHFYIGSACKIHPNLRIMADECVARDNVTQEMIEAYSMNKAFLLEQEFYDRKIKSESNVIILDMVDIYRNLTRKLKLSYFFEG